MAVTAALLSRAEEPKQQLLRQDKFDYTVEQFADLQILRYRVPGFEDLSLKTKRIGLLFDGSGFAGQRHSFRPEWQV